jgi:hypothetical protein
VDAQIQYGKNLMKWLGETFITQDGRKLSLLCYASLDRNASYPQNKSCIKICGERMDKKGNTPPGIHSREVYSTASRSKT